MISLLYLSSIVCLLLFSTSSSATEVQKFHSCGHLNSFYYSRVLPLVGPNGISSSNAYIKTRFVPDRPVRANVPGGPAGLRLRFPFREPTLVAFSNLTKKEADDAEEANEDGPVEGQDFSGTNVQIKGVDEPDIVKTDGRRMFTLSGSILSVIQVLANGRRGKRIGKLKLPTNPEEMLIEGDYLLVISREYNYVRPIYRRFKREPSTDEETTIVHQVFVKNGKPRIVSTLQLEGRYIRSRESDGIARIVLRFNPLSPIWLYYPSGKATEKQTKRWNREIIMYSRPSHWLPTYTFRRGKRVQYGTYVNCLDTFYSNDVFAGLNILTVVTIPVNGTITPGSSASIISDSQTVYSTKETMYVTTSELRFGDSSNNDNNNERWGVNYRTAIHKFALSNTGAKYQASGIITGSVINQFAMHERGDNLFIATTDGAPWWGNRDLSASKITAFKTVLKRRRLVKIGEVGNLGVGERIFAVRYRSDTAYVVTFREIDPLYIIDLENPRKMKVLGELKIPGFSSYLHWIGRDRLLGVGQEATLDGRTTGAKVSLFDTSDKSNPKELTSWTLKGSYSDAEWDHRAFLYWWRERIAVMPVNVFSGSKTFRGSIVLDITPNTITERGRIVHKTRSSSYVPSIKRNAIIGKKYLWSMSDLLVQVNNVRKLNEVTSQVKISS